LRGWSEGLKLGSWAGQAEGGTEEDEGVGSEEVEGGSHRGIEDTSRSSDKRCSGGRVDDEGGC
jgi:hypothetical protein